MVGGERLEVKLEDSSQADEARSILGELSDEAPWGDDGTVAITLRERSGAIADAVRRLDARGVGIDDIALRRPTLDDVFLTLTGKPPEPEEESDPTGEHEQVGVS
jgi:ABC-2 type transport system ATP-binding protein